MNKIEHLLTVVSEESAEVGQRACKAIRFGLSEIQPGQQEDNKRRLERELADLMATAELLGLQIKDEDKAAKREKLMKYMDYSRIAGTLKVEGPVAHCYGSHCNNPTYRCCICICSMCGDAKKQDH